MRDEIEIIEARDIDTDEIISVISIKSINSIISRLDEMRGDIDSIKIILEERKEKVFQDDWEAS